MQLILTVLCVSLFSILTIALSDTDNESVKAVTQEKKKDNDICDMSAAVNGFNFDMQKKVSESNKNMIFSPFSIYAALGMLSIAARGKSKKEIVSALRWGNSKRVDKLNALKKLNTELSNENLSGDVKIEIANNGWVANDINVLSGFQMRLKKYFDVTLGIEDFVNDSKAAREKINNWVSQNTGQLINDLFPESAINADTKLALANAIYFKGSWKNPFDEDYTRSNVFYNLDGTTENVTFMAQNEVFKGARYRNVQFLEMPYLKETFSMLFAMPMMNNEPTDDDFTDVNALINGMDQKLLNESLARLEEQYVSVRVPKFKIKQGLDLKPLLTSLGINDAFDINEANLSGINGNKMLYVSSAMHKAFVQVDEKGTRAGSASGFSMLSRMMVPQVKFNRPFLFFILNKRCDSIIFAGKIINPLE